MAAEARRDEDVPRQKWTDLRDEYNAAVGHVEATADALDREKALPDDQRNADDIDRLTRELANAVARAEVLEVEVESKEARDRARQQFRKIDTPESVRVVSEPDIYQRGGRNFFQDLFMAQVRNDRHAADRIYKHQDHEIQKRAVTTSTVGGIIPPQYLVDMYANALRNGRVIADQVNHQTLPSVGMSLVVPRLTTATAAGVQTSENSTVTTQDPAETDLTVNVRTVAGYLPVSRQTIDRGGYTDQLLFEDLVARYAATLDTQVINGSGSSGQMLGILQTSSILTSTTSTATVAATWPKIADVIQQVNTQLGGLGYVASKCFMHPRRWGFFEAALDSQNRPLMVPSGTLAANSVNAFNPTSEGVAAGYGLVGSIHGLPVYIDANIPTNLGSGTNEDRIIVVAHDLLHLWERDGDPITVSFEQQAGTSLQVQLVVYGYAAFTAGRFPQAVGVVSGAGLATPTF